MQKLTKKLIAAAITLSLAQTLFGQNHQEKKDLLYSNRVSVFSHRHCEARNNLFA